VTLCQVNHIFTKKYGIGKDFIHLKLANLESNEEICWLFIYRKFYLQNYFK